MYHNVQYLLLFYPFAVPSVCSIVELQCLILVKGLYIVPVDVSHICKTVSEENLNRCRVCPNLSFHFVLAAFLNLSGVCLHCVLCCTFAHVLVWMFKHRSARVFPPLIVCEIINFEPWWFTVRPTGKKETSLLVGTTFCNKGKKNKQKNNRDAHVSRCKRLDNVSALSNPRMGSVSDRYLP